MKYMIAPTQRIGEYWAREMGLVRGQYRVISEPDRIRGVRLKRSQVVYIEEEPFDYPEYTIKRNRHDSQWYELVLAVNQMLDRNYAKDI